MYRDHCHLFGFVAFLVAVIGLVLSLIALMKVRQYEDCYDDFTFDDDDADIPYFTADISDDEDDVYADADDAADQDPTA